MGLTYSIADTCLLDGFQASMETARRRLTVSSDTNAANVGVIFYAVFTPGVTIDLQTELGLDPRFTASAEVRSTDDPMLEHSAIVADDYGQQWKVVRVERNAASPVNKYWCVQVEERLDT